MPASHTSLCVDILQAPGELGTFGQAWNPYPDNPVAFSKLQLKELKNGRLAMLAILGKVHVYKRIKTTVRGHVLTLRYFNMLCYGITALGPVPPCCLVASYVCQLVQKYREYTMKYEVVRAGF